MDNANKAILMAFGMLVAVMILGTIVFVFSRLKSLPMQDDEKESIEQLRLFNQEYEVYDKKIMYGVDVISVLNKAQSNNEKYVQTKFFSGVGYNTDYIINIVVKFNKDLNESVKVSYLQNGTSGKTVEQEYTNGEGPSGTNSLNFSDVFKAYTPDNGKYQNLIYKTGENPWEGKLCTKEFSTQIKNGTYQLLSDNGNSGPTSSPFKPNNGVTNYTNDMIEQESTLKSLISQSATMSRTVRNTSDSKYGKGTGWNQATWYPAIYEMKTRKFKCTKSAYNSKTGRMCYMEFEEK